MTTISFQPGIKPAAKRGNGDSFLAKAKEDFATIIGEYGLAAAEHGASAELFDGLSKDVWALVEKITKQSYKNGIVRGKQGEKKS